MSCFNPIRFVFLAFLALAYGPVQAQPITDGQTYLARNAIQQEIFLTRQLRAQGELVAECAPGTDAEAFRPGFNAWLADNPRFLSRPIQFAITAALLDLCK